MNLKLGLVSIYTLFVTLCALLIVAICTAENSNLRFAWDAVTTNADETPCTDLAGYAIYRSREADNWNTLTGAEPAFVQVTATETFVAVTCPEPGVWYWMVRAFNTSGNYSYGTSNIIMTDIDTIIPGAIFHFRTCQPGDINCDGDIDGSDLIVFSEAFGK